MNLISSQWDADLDLVVLTMRPETPLCFETLLASWQMAWVAVSGSTLELAGR